LTLRLRYTLGRYIPFLKTAPPPPREMVFSLRPIRNSAIEWETNEEGEALLRVPLRKDRMGRFIQFWFRLPETRSYELDEVGTFVWSLCDGSNSVDAIVRQTGKQYKMNRREVEISVTTYLQELARRRLIGFYQREGRGK